MKKVSDKNLTELAGEVFNTSLSSLSNQVRSGSIGNKSLQLIGRWALENEIDLNWLLRGENPPPGHFFKIEEPAQRYDPHGGWRPQTQMSGEYWELLGLAHEILSSDTVYKAALAANIRAFHQALISEKSTHEKIDDLERQIKDNTDFVHQMVDDYNKLLSGQKDRRKMERRQKNVEHRPDRRKRDRRTSR